MKQIGILIADDHTIVRMGLSSLLATEPGLVIVGEASDGLEAVAETTRLAPDVVVLDLMMPRMDGLMATREIKKSSPSTKIIILTSFATADGIAHALECGASGAVLKNAAETELVPAIQAAVAGKTFLSDEIRAQLEANPPLPQLTPRQTEILTLLSNGLTNKQIANQLGIRSDGVDDHVIAIFRKLGVNNRAEAVGLALRKNLLKS